MDFHLITALFLFLLGVITSFVSTNTGGGALVSIPTLILLGFPPINAIAAVKLGRLGTTISGLVRFQQNKTVKYKVALPASVIASIGAIIGANLLISIPFLWINQFLGALIIFVLVLTWIYNYGLLPYRQRKSIRILGYILFLFIGILGGILGASGTFSTFVLLTCFGLTFIEAAGTRKVIGLCINVIALLIYAFHHLIYYKYAFFLFAGTVIGSYVGASFGIYKGNQWIRTIFSIVTFVLAIKLLF